MSRIALHFLLLGALVLAGCSGKEKETEWGVYNEPVESRELPQSAGLTELETSWSRNVGGVGEDGYALLRPAVDAEGVYVANRSGDLLRLDSVNGKVSWRRDLDRPVYAAVGLGEGMVLAGLDNGTIVALDAASGETRWESAIQRQISAIPAAGSGRVIVRTADGLVIGLNAVDGKQVWSVQRNVPGLSLHGDSTPLISGDTVITGLANGRIMANAVVNGRDFWETDLSFVGGTNELEQLTDIDSTPVLQGSGLYAATYQGDVVAVEIQTSSVRWRQPVSTRLPMSVGEEALFVTGSLGEIVAISTDSGEVLWRYDAFQGRGMSNPLGVGKRVVVGDAEGYLHLLDRADGSLLQSVRIDRSAIISLVSLDTGLVAFSAAGDVVAATVADN
jgi:outer membrane protein assembly factor BamB